MSSVGGKEERIVDEIDSEHEEQGEFTKTPESEDIQEVPQTKNSITKMSKILDICISHIYSEILVDTLSLKKGRPKINDNVNGEEDKVNGKQRQGKRKETGDYTMERSNDF